MKAFKKGFQLQKVKSPQEKKEEKEMKYTLAFHAEGKKGLQFMLRKGKERCTNWGIDGPVESVERAFLRALGSKFEPC